LVAGIREKRTGQREAKKLKKGPLEKRLGRRHGRRNIQILKKGRNRTGRERKSRSRLRKQALGDKGKGEEGGLLGPKRAPGRGEKEAEGVGGTGISGLKIWLRREGPE